jgi:hypothetical protein
MRAVPWLYTYNKFSGKHRSSVEISSSSVGSRQLAVGDSHWKKSAGEDLTCYVNTLSQCSVVRFGAIAVNCECRLGQRRLV